MEQRADFPLAALLQVEWRRTRVKGKGWHIQARDDNLHPVVMGREIVRSGRTLGTF